MVIFTNVIGMIIEIMIGGPVTDDYLAASLFLWSLFGIFIIIVESIRLLIGVQRASQ